MVTLLNVLLGGVLGDVQNGLVQVMETALTRVGATKDNAELHIVLCG